MIMSFTLSAAEVATLISCTMDGFDCAQRLCHLVAGCLAGLKVYPLGLKQLSSRVCRMSCEQIFQSCCSCRAWILCLPGETRGPLVKICSSYVNLFVLKVRRAIAFGIWENKACYSQKRIRWKNYRKTFQNLLWVILLFSKRSRIKVSITANSK